MTTMMTMGGVRGQTTKTLRGSRGQLGGSLVRHRNPAVVVQPSDLPSGGAVDWKEALVLRAETPEETSARIVAEVDAMASKVSRYNVGSAPQGVSRKDQWWQANAAKYLQKALEAEDGDYEEVIQALSSVGVRVSPFSSPSRDLQEKQLINLAQVLKNNATFVGTLKLFISELQNFKNIDAEVSSQVLVTFRELARALVLSTTSEHVTTRWVCSWEKLHVVFETAGACSIVEASRRPVEAARALQRVVDSQFSPLAKLIAAKQDREFEEAVRPVGEWLAIKLPEGLFKPVVGYSEPFRINWDRDPTLRGLVGLAERKSYSRGSEELRSGEIGRSLVKLCEEAQSAQAYLDQLGGVYPRDRGPRYYSWRVESYSDTSDGETVRLHDWLSSRAPLYSQFRSLGWRSKVEDFTEVRLVLSAVCQVTEVFSAAYRAYTTEVSSALKKVNPEVLRRGLTEAGKTILARTTVLQAAVSICRVALDALDLASLSKEEWKSLFDLGRSLLINYTSELAHSVIAAECPGWVELISLALPSSSELESRDGKYTFQLVEQGVDSDNLALLSARCSELTAANFVRRCQRFASSSIVHKLGEVFSEWPGRSSKAPDHSLNNRYYTVAVEADSFESATVRVVVGGGELEVRPRCTSGVLQAVVEGRASGMDVSQALAITAGLTIGRRNRKLFKVMTAHVVRLARYSGVTSQLLVLLRSELFGLPTHQSPGFSSYGRFSYALEAVKSAGCEEDIAGKYKEVVSYKVNRTLETAVCSLAFETALVAILKATGSPEVLETFRKAKAGIAWVTPVSYDHSEVSADEVVGLLNTSLSLAGWKQTLSRVAKRVTDLITLAGDTRGLGDYKKNWATKLKQLVKSESVIDSYALTLVARPLEQHTVYAVGKSKFSPMSNFSGLEAVGDKWLAEVTQSFKGTSKFAGYAKVVAREHLRTWPYTEDNGYRMATPAEKDLYLFDEEGRAIDVKTGAVLPALPIHPRSAQNWDKVFTPKEKGGVQRKSRGGIEKLEYDAQPSGRIGPEYPEVTDQVVLCSRFGLGSVTFGSESYMTAKAVEFHTRSVFLGLADFLEVIGLDPSNEVHRKILAADTGNGNLMLNFGGMGRSKAAAHFNAQHNIVAVTKEGAGSLCHEIVHALDWWLGRAASIDGSAVKASRKWSQKVAMAEFLSSFPVIHSVGGSNKRAPEFVPLDLVSTTTSGNVEGYKVVVSRNPSDSYAEAVSRLSHAIVASLYDVVLHLYFKASEAFSFSRLSDLGFDYSDSVIRSLRWYGTDYAQSANTLGVGYWLSPWEMLARASEAYFSDWLEASERKNTYLVDRGRTTSPYAVTQEGGSATVVSAYPMSPFVFDNQVVRYQYSGNDREAINARLDVFWALVGCLLGLVCEAQVTRDSLFSFPSIFLDSHKFLFGLSRQTALNLLDGGD